MRKPSADRLVAERAALHRAAERFEMLRLAGVRQLDLPRVRSLAAACKMLADACDDVFQVESVEHPGEVGQASIEAVEILAMLGPSLDGWPAAGASIAGLVVRVRALGAAAAEVGNRPAVAEPVYRWVACAADEWSRAGLGRIGHGNDARFSLALRAFGDLQIPKLNSIAQLRSAITVWRSSAVHSPD